MLSYYNSIAQKSMNLSLEATYYFLDLTFEIYSDSWELYQRTDRFLAPHLEKNRTGAAEIWKIFYIFSAIQFGLEREEKVIGIYGKNSVITAGFCEQDGIYFYYNNESGNETIINLNERKAFILYSCSSINLNLLEDCYSVIRNILYRHLLKHGAILIHGCALSVNNTTIILAGEKEVGKTTIQHYLLQELKADFISADRTLVWIQNDQVTCTGWISTYRPNIDIFQLLPPNEGATKLKAYYEEHKNDPLYFQKNKIRIAPRDLVDLLGIKSRANAGLDQVIIIEAPTAGQEYKLAANAPEQRQLIIEPYLIDLKREGVQVIPEEEMVFSPSSTRNAFVANTGFWRLSGRGRLEDLNTLFQTTIIKG